MSRGNVEIVKRAYEAFNAGGLEQAMEFLDPGIVWEDLDALPGADIYRGHAELREAFRRFFDAWDDLTASVEELIDAGDVVVVAQRWHGTGKSSGTPVDTLRWNLLTVRNGKIVHRRAFADRAAALKDAGLSD